MRGRNAGTIGVALIISTYLVYLIAMAEAPELMAVRFGDSPWTLMVVAGMGLILFIVLLVFVFAFLTKRGAD